MKDKKLEILLVEDNPDHIKAAKEYFLGKNLKKAGIEISYVKTYEEAQQVMQGKEISGIISDVFFPWDDKLGGWNRTAANKCTEILEPIVERFQSTPDYYWKARKALDYWKNCVEMHPTGVLMVEAAIKKELPIVLCTDTYHHGYKTEPVDQYSSKKKIKMIDVDMYEETDRYTLSGRDKDWNSAFVTVLSEIELKKNKKVIDRMFENQENIDDKIKALGKNVAEKYKSLVDRNEMENVMSSRIMYV